MAVRQIFGVVGAVIGAIVGGPAGAQYGWMIGSMFGNEFDPPTIQGPQVGEVSTQTSQEGTPRPQVFGQSPPIAGNIIATGPPVKIKRRKRQGKGGPVVETEAVLRTYAIGICEGPIRRFLRVWRNGQIVWDGRDNEDLRYGPPDPDDVGGAQFAAWILRKLTNNLEFEQRVDFYLGTYDQEPSPYLEEIYGVGTTPAFRGTAYMMIQDDDITDFRGAVPQYLFQVERCEGDFVTSRPYALEEVDALGHGGSLVKALPQYIYEDAMDHSASIESGELRALLRTYTDGDAEALDHSGAIESGELRTILRAYTDGDTEALDHAGSIESGDLDTILITYQNGDTEALDHAGSIESGSLT